jgi:hypothetical protein
MLAHCRCAARSAPAMREALRDGELNERRGRDAIGLVIMLFPAYENVARPISSSPHRNSKAHVSVGHVASMLKCCYIFLLYYITVVFRGPRCGRLFIHFL